MAEPVIVDTDILSNFLRGQENVTNRFVTHIDDGGTIRFTILIFYETVSGLKHRDAYRQLDSFLDFSNHGEVVPLTEESELVAADAFAALR